MKLNSMGNYLTMLFFPVLAFIQRAIEWGLGGWVKRVHSQLLTPEAPQGKFDQLSVNQLLLWSHVWAAQDLSCQCE